ncbi:MAG: low molecular weight phosphatase family protein [Kiritimatiellaeota bacterium]|nr:low molecular weight phosphatase family protein [Kiritimatiellota bacterium]
MKQILFICSGNYYRSRFAEAVFNHLAIQRGLPWRAFSRGLAPWMAEGDLSVWTEEALLQRGIDRALTGPTRIKLTEADLQRAHLTIALKEAEHREMMRDQFPAWEHRITYWAIHDLACAQPEDVLPLLEARVHALADALALEPQHA